MEFEDRDIPRKGIKKVLIPRKNLPNRTIYEIDYKVLLKRKKGSKFNSGLTFTILEDYRAPETEEPQPQLKDYGWLGFR